MVKVSKSISTIIRQGQGLVKGRKVKVHKVKGRNVKVHKLWTTKSDQQGNQQGQNGQEINKVKGKMVKVKEMER